MASVRPTYEKQLQNELTIQIRWATDWKISCLRFQIVKQNTLLHLKYKQAHGSTVLLKYAKSPVVYGSLRELFSSYMCGGLGKPVTLTKHNLHFYLRNRNLHYLHILYCLLYSKFLLEAKLQEFKEGPYQKLLKEKNEF